VKVGIRRPGKVEILEGLAEGDEVVTAGQQRAQKDGTAVKVVELGKPGGKPAGSTPAPATAPTAPSAAVTALPVSPAVVVTPPVMSGKPVATAKIAQKPLQGPNPCLESASVDAKSAGNMRRKS
jgi:membrane fusion protein (multidrug efflux system)